jgi:hypothetical protein
LKEGGGSARYTRHGRSAAAAVALKAAKAVAAAAAAGVTKPPPQLSACAVAATGYVAVLVFLTMEAFLFGECALSYWWLLFA